MHGDLCGPVTPGGRHYFLLFLDDVSHYMWVMVLGSKGEAADAIRRTQAATEVECGKLRVLRTDNGGEFTVVEFVSYCIDEGIQCHYSTPYNPQQNSIIKQRNQTVVGMAWARLKQRVMPAVF
jgi:transposase InsO family protein